MSVRELVFATTSGDPQLIALGLTASTTYGNGAPLSPKEQVFGILKWGTEINTLPGQRGAGKVTERDVALWVYDKSDDYGRINAAIKRWCVLMDALSATKTGSAAGDGWVTCCEWAGDGDDSYDDQYERITRWSSYTIIASGN